MGAELQRKDIISDEALEAPLILAKNMEVAYQATMKVAKASREFDGSGSDNIKTTREETQKLTAEQIELIKVQKQIATVQARNNEEYQKEVQALAALKKAMKDKTALGEKDATTISAQNASMKELNAALQKNKQAYEQLATAEKRESQEGKELLKVIQAQDAQLKHLKDTIGENQLSVGKYENATKNLKIQLKAAKDEMAGIASTLGSDSKEFQDAAAKAGELKNEIGDLEASMSAMSGSKMENVAGSFGLMGQKLKALDFKGATAAGKQFIGATKAMTFKEATAGIKTFAKQMFIAGLQLLKNPYVLLAAVIIGIGAALIKLKNNIPFVSKAFDAMGAAFDYVIQKAKDFLDMIGLTTFAADEAAQKSADIAKKRIDDQVKYYDQAIAIARAQGKETLALEIEQQKAIIKEAEKGLKGLEELRGRYGKLTPEQQAQFDENIQAIADANTQIQVLQETHLTELENKRKAAAEKEKADALKLSSFLASEEAKRLKKIVDNGQAQVDARIQASIELEEVQKKLAENERDAALMGKDQSASAIKLIEKKFQADLTAIHQQGAQNRLDITNDFADDEQKAREKKLKADIKKIQAHADEQNKILDAQEDAIKQKIIQGVGDRDQNEKELDALMKQHAIYRIQVAIQEVEATMALYAEGTDERAELAKKLYALQKSLTDAEVDNVAKAEKTKLEKAEKTFADLQQIYGDYAQGISELSGALTEKRLAELEKESEANKEALDASLEQEDEALKHRLDNEMLSDEQKKALEETSAARKETLEKAAAAREEKIQAQKRKAVRRQAIMDKALALVQTQINAAQSMVASAKMGFPAAIPFIAAAAFLGASQAAAIIAKPIPAAEKGIKGHKGGPIIAGEAGPELVRMPGNRLALTDAVATVYDLPRGTDIIPHEQTVQMLASQSLGRIDNARGTPLDSTVRLEKKLDRINSTIKNKREWNLTGKVTGYNDGGTRAKYIEQLRNRPQQ